jgi:two-component system cell cycle sensor histidine kinase/response regulator CckA
MPGPLRLLLVEDSELDARLILRALARSGLLPHHRRVATGADLRAALREERWDVLLSDHALPAFSSTEALAVLEEERAAGHTPELVDLPFIIVSGTIGEETAVEAMRAGARDYILKDRLGRLAPAIERELREARGRRQRRQVQEEMQLQLHHAQKMECVGRLAGGVAHDFNNLLTCFVGYGGLLRKRLPDGDVRLRYVEGMLEAADHGASLTRQLLAFSRRQPLSPTVTSLNAIVLDTHKFLRRLIGEDLELVTDLASELANVKVDAGQMQQVILNLSVNARDAMPEGGRLTIATANAPGGDRVTLSVSDTGTGMSPQALEHLFEPFFTTKEGGKGTGLGLSTVYGIVTQNGGAVTCTSQPGHGTTFTVSLPSSRETVARVEASAPVRATPVTETVLLVEDEERVREIATEVLVRCGYVVLSEPSAEAALARAQGHAGPIQLLLTDVVLPGMNGRELAERLRASRPDSRVLYTSGYTDELAILHGLSGPGTLFLAKPYDPTALVRSVREVLNTPNGPNVPNLPNVRSAAA